MSRNSTSSTIHDEVFSEDSDMDSLEDDNFNTLDDSVGGTFQRVKRNSFLRKTTAKLENTFFSQRKSALKAYRHNKSRNLLDEQEDILPRQTRRDRFSSSISRSREATKKIYKKGEHKIKNIRNQFVNSEKFKEITERAFLQCDLDNSETIDAGELWAGILFLYIELNKIPWGGYKNPPKKQDVLNLMHEMDINNDGVLDFDEFLNFCKVLCQDIVVNVSFKMFIVMLLCPLLADVLTQVLVGVFSVILPPVASILTTIPKSVLTSIVTACTVAGIPLMEKKYAPDIPRWKNYYPEEFVNETMEDIGEFMNKSTRYLGLENERVNDISNFVNKSTRFLGREKD